MAVTMPTLDIIKEVSLSLGKLLEAKLALNGFSNTKVTYDDPDKKFELPTMDFRINLYLYSVKENAAFKNIEYEYNPTDDTIKYRPLSLRLYYLLTPYIEKNVAEIDEPLIIQQLLGRAMRILDEFSIIPKDFLTQIIKDHAREELKVTITDLDIDTKTKIWGATTKPMKLSVGYEVDVAQIFDSYHTSIQHAPPVIITDVENYPLDEELMIHTVMPNEGPVNSEVSIFGNGFRENVKVKIGNTDVPTTNILAHT